MKIFSGSSNIPLANKVSDLLKTPLTPLEIHVFPDGEKRVRVTQNVVGEQCIVIAPTCAPTDANYMELFFILDALKRSGAKSVSAVLPYFGYERQDHIFRDGEAVSSDVIANILETVGATKVCAFDLHSIRLPEIFKIPFVHLSALPLFEHTIKKLTIKDENACLVSPDMGGIRRIKILSVVLNMPFAVIEKNRDLDSGKISANRIEGKISECAFIVDDIISSGETMVKAATMAQNAGAKKIFAFATHAVFSGNAAELLQNSVLEKVFVTDSVFIPKEKHFKKLSVLSIAPLIAQKINDLL